MDVRDVLGVGKKSSFPLGSLKRSHKAPEPPSLSVTHRQHDEHNFDSRSKTARLSSTPGSDNRSRAAVSSEFKEPSSVAKLEHRVNLEEEKKENGDKDEEDTEITESTVRKMAVLLEKRILTNQEARTKFPDQPTKFMESEIELQETLESMQILAASPNLYPVLAGQSRPVHLLLGLLSHENTDISINVVDLLNSLLEPVGLKDAGKDAANPLLDILFNNQLVQLLTQNLSRLNETVKDEADGVHTTLNIIESLLDVRPEMSFEIAQQGIFAWLLRRVQRRPFDRNKLYVSEILSILLQLNEPTDGVGNKTRLGEMEGIDILLQQLAIYKRHDPTTREEAEMMYNLFDCLCSALMVAGNKDKFLKGEGVQLMNLMLREKHAARDCALKVLDYAMSVVSTSPGTSSSSEDEVADPFLSEGEAAAAANCNKFVEVLGLRTIFPLFMHSPQARGLRLAVAIQEKSGSLPGPTASEMEEHIISIVVSLLRQCTGQHQARVLAKFVENEHEKVDRFIELHFRFQEKMVQAQQKVDQFRKRLSSRPDITKEELDEMVSIKLMDSGRLTLQLIDVSLLFICVHGQPSIGACVKRLLKMRGSSIASITKTAEEYAENLGDDRQTTTHEKTRVLSLLKRFKVAMN